MASPDSAPSTPNARSPLDRARMKAYWRLIPLLFICYAVAYVDRTNVAIATLRMADQLPAFDSRVIGWGSGIFFLGYFLLEVPGSLIVERWSARLWISRIMITWGLMAGLTAFVREPWHFYVVRFLLGLAEAGFYPGVIVYLTHWFPTRDRARALAYFFIAAPLAQAGSPPLSKHLLKIGTTEVVDGVEIHHDTLMGLVGWQWVYIFWAIPAVILGFVVLALLTDRPRQARWLAADEREALEEELAREKELKARDGSVHTSFRESLKHPKVQILTVAYLLAVMGNYGIEFFMPRILKAVHHLTDDQVTFLVIFPPLGSLVGQLFVGWNSDRVGERRMHVVLPIYLAAAALGVMAFVQLPPLWLTLTLFILALTGLKAYLPAFWTMPYLFLSQAAAAGSIGLINSVGNLGGFVGPSMMGELEKRTGSYQMGLGILAGAILISGTIFLLLGLGKRAEPGPADRDDSLAEALA
ncbi:MFS transporter [Tundrisphaera sp. TA3]|uniref:MFS transporter n=1 Tax=Tundrisphaera sp. TA3 TaxID=3435775 RepID=UPI003EBD90A0